MCDTQSPDPKKALKNLTRPMGLRKKISLFLTNNLSKLRKRQTCCGHYGEPGC